MNQTKMRRLKNKTPCRNHIYIFVGRLCPGTYQQQQGDESAQMQPTFVKNDDLLIAIHVNHELSQLWRVRDHEIAWPRPYCGSSH